MSSKTRRPRKTDLTSRRPQAATDEAVAFSAFEPEPSGFNPVPREVNPVPREVNPVPREVNPVPREVNPVLRGFNPTPPNFNPPPPNFNPTPPGFNPTPPSVNPTPAAFAPEADFLESALPEPFAGITGEQLQQIVPNLPAAKREEYLICLNEAMREFHIDTPLRVAAFIAQTAHESGEYCRLVENLNYSAQGLLGTWPRRFNTSTSRTYARKPDRIASLVYANRLGNGDEASGDGWHYRGRGVIQVTGRDNYRDCGDHFEVDLVASPELLEQARLAFRSAAWFWHRHGLNELADEGDFVAITRAINGRTKGLAQRRAYYQRAKEVLGIA
jgi:putative chitinase